MKYMLLIYENEKNWQGMTEAKRNEVMAEYMKFTDAIKATGHLRAGDALQPVSTATTVRMREGKRLHTDGPFAETKEQLGGYYVVEAKDLDEAIGIAARIPGSRTGSIEVRPLMTFE
jgi:hypothetical protein